MAMNGDQSGAKPHRQRGGLLVLLIVLGGALAVLCHQAFLPHQVHWANDIPLGAMLDPSARLPGTFAGHWITLTYIGAPAPSSCPSLTTLLQMVFPPEIFLKIFLPLSMLFLGVGAGLFFRQSGFAPGVCVVGGLGAGLNMHYFSNGSWGLGVWAMSAAMVFVSLAVLVSPSIRPLWVKSALVGLAVGLVVMDGYDVGAILSIYAGIFVVFYFLTAAPNPIKGIPRTIGAGVVVVLFALLISGSTLFTLVGTQIKGVANAGQSEAEKRDHWVFLSTFSLPKLETIRLFIPGVFGYRLQDYTTDTNKAGVYWGSIGEDLRVDELESSNPETRVHAVAALGASPEVQNVMAGNDMTAREQIMDQIKSQMQRRHTGSGDYIGVLVCLLAVFGLCNSWRKLDSPYSKNERNAVWFWGSAALISLLAAWGRYAPLYQFIARLPFLSNIRNPIKFLHPFNLCLIILSGYGLEALHRRYMSGAVNRTGSLPQHVLRWWRKAAGFDKKWAGGTLLFLGAALISLLLLTSSKNDLVHYLEHSGFSAAAEQMPQQAAHMADFCIREVVLFILFFAASAGVVIGILSGAWSGRRATWAWVFLGAIMILDLLRADAPWVRYFDYTQKYSMNPVVDFLRHDPWEHRVMSRFLPTGGYIPGEGSLGALCHWWLENDYLANNIESLEIDQAPRLPDLDRNYIGNFTPRVQQDLASPVRMWRLTNTRYILADARVTPVLNQVAEPKNSFTNVMLMDIVVKPGVVQPEDAGDLTVQTNDNGHVALIEFTAALPRAKLYSNWQMADDTTTLAKLNSSEFDPTKTVLIANDTPVAQKPAQPAADPGAVTITSYQPREVTVQADAKTPAVLLLNDRTGEYWNVRVDQKPASLLRCNYIMRGVFLPPGQHTIVFRFQPPLQWLYVSVAAFASGVLLCGYVIFTRLGRAPESSTAPEKTPAEQNRKSA
jgi:hypothetical protein